MILVYSIILILLCVIIVGYPLFFERLRFFHLPEINPENDQEYLFDEQESLLTALSELEDEYLLGKVSKEDYKQQKLDDSFSGSSCVNDQTYPSGSDVHMHVSRIFNVHAGRMEI